MASMVRERSALKTVFHGSSLTSDARPGSQRTTELWSLFLWMGKLLGETLPCSQLCAGWIHQFPFTSIQNYFLQRFPHMILILFHCLSLASIHEGLESDKKLDIWVVQLYFPFFNIRYGRKFTTFLKVGALPTSQLYTWFARDMGLFKFTFIKLNSIWQCWKRPRIILEHRESGHHSAFIWLAKVRNTVKQKFRKSDQGHSSWASCPFFEHKNSPSNAISSIVCMGFACAWLWPPLQGFPIIETTSPYPGTLTAFTTSRCSWSCVPCNNMDGECDLVTCSTCSVCSARARLSKPELQSPPLT